MKNRRQAPKINAGSMADIAFLLLIFWLVATTIKPEVGWKDTLTSKDEEPKIAVVTNQSDIYRIYVKEDKLELNGNEVALVELEKFLEIGVRRAGFRLKVVLSADYDSSYKRYTEVIELAKKFNVKIIYNEI